LFRNKLLLAALVALVTVSVLLAFAGVRAGQPGGGIGDIIRVLL